MVSALVLASGYILAVASVVFIVRTLRPLRVLRARVREVAGGDYARRTGVVSVSS